MENEIEDLTIKQEDLNQMKGKTLGEISSIVE